MNYVITNRGKEETAASFSPKVAAVLEMFQDEGTSNAKAIAQVTGIPPGEVKSIIRGLIKERIIAPEESEGSFMSKMLRRG